MENGYRFSCIKLITIGVPTSQITKILDQLESAKYFSVFDFASGFSQIPMHESDVQKKLSPFRMVITILTEF